MASELKVLALDDEKDIRDLVTDILSSNGIQTMVIGSPIQLPEAMMAFRPDVLLLDQMLPEKSGSQIIKEVRASNGFSRIPIIILSGKTGEEDKVGALGLGADDYVTKPFSPKELVARIQAVYRRANSLNNDKSCFECRELKVDLRAGRATIRGREIPLTLTEFKLLVELISNKGRVMSREILRESVIGKEEITDRTIDVHMAGLRRKMGDTGKEIRTVRGIGYRFND